VDVLDTLRRALVDRYAIERELGQGGMATVYLARDIKHDRRVALKVLRPELAASLGLDRFLLEIRTTAQLTHPHILPLHDSGEAAGFLYYVMPFVEGETLRDRLTREKQLPLDDALQLAREVADALSYAHAHGVVHRDIKPENILLQSGHAVVADFGIAKAIAAAGSERLTETGLSIGTPAYMSPEQAAGSGDLDGRSDLYSLGCVLYEMLAGEPPFTGPSAQAVVAKRLSTPAPRISILRDRVPAHVEHALDTALARTPADRFATAALFAEALGNANAPGHRRTGAPWSPLAKWLVAGGVLVAAVLVVLLATGVLRLGGSAGGGARMTSLAVLPLRNLSGDSTQEYVADGMTEAIITELGKISALTVISRTSVMGYKGKQMPLRDIARELGVQGIVEGSVMREGGQVRITARLIDGRTDRRLWDSTYNRQMSSILALYAEVARTIAGNIGATLTPDEARRLQVVRTVNPQAYDEWLLGQQVLGTMTADAVTRAIAHYRRAIELDSTFADPHATLSGAYRWLAQLGTMSSAEAVPLARAEAERAIALDPGSARAHVTLARQLSTEWRWEEAGREYRRAVELNPGWAMAVSMYGGHLIFLGRYDEAIRYALRAVELDPRDFNMWDNLGWAYFYAGRFQESIAPYQRALQLEPSDWFTHMYLAVTYSALGRHQEAIESVGRALKEDSENQAILSCAVVVYASAGRPAVARRFLDSLLAQGTKGRPAEPYQVGYAYAWLGETDRALENFSRAIDERSTVVQFLKTEILPARFKADPRYHALLRRIGLE
jgi:serine/threonine-protein kinase